MTKLIGIQNYRSEYKLILLNLIKKRTFGSTDVKINS